MGEYAAAYVAAMQWGEGYNGAPEDTTGVPLKTANTCKHFAGYGLEHWNNTIRYAFNAVISRQDLYATYLPAFQACVELAKVAMLSACNIKVCPICTGHTAPLNTLALLLLSFQPSTTTYYSTFTSPPPPSMAF